MSFGCAEERLGAPVAKSDAKKKAKAEVEEVEGSAPTVKAAGADQWAKAVVDGVPSEADDALEPDQVFAEQTSDIPLDALGLADAETTDEDIDDQIIDAEIVEDAEPVEEADVAVAKIHEDAEPGVEVIEEVMADEAVSGDAPEGVPGAEGGPSSDISVEDLVLDLERVTGERDQYLDASRRLQAEFENYKKQVGKREIEARERANDSLVGELLPVLDAFDGAVANGAEDVVPMRTSFLDALAKHGLERIDPSDAPFDPNLHEAVLHEDADDTDGPVVAEVMRAGYVWKGRVLRPAMVRTRG